MKAIEFNTKIEDVSFINIPKTFQKEFIDSENKNVRVIVLVEEKEYQEERLFKSMTVDNFLKGYSESDSIYDQE